MRSHIDKMGCSEVMHGVPRYFFSASNATISLTAKTTLTQNWLAHTKEKHTPASAQSEERYNHRGEGTRNKIAVLVGTTVHTHTLTLGWWESRQGR